MTRLRVGEAFPDFELPDHSKRPRRLSSYARPSALDERLGFDDGYPLILVFGRGFFCPRDQEQMRGLVRFQSELAVNYCKLLNVSADPPMVGAAFRAGLGAEWPFLSDEGREVIRCIGILDETEGEYAGVSRPFTFVLGPDLRIHRIYDGWFFVGRPTLEELRRDLRDESVDQFAEVEGLRFKAWISDDATERWGAVYVWESADAARQPLPGRARELIGKDPDIAEEFDVEATIEGAFAVAELSRRGLAFET